MATKKATKNDLVNGIYKRTSIEKREILDVLDAFLEEAKKSLISGATIELRGFGTLEPRLRKGRSCARNPKNGDMVSVEPHYVAAFRAGQELKQKLWELPIDYKEF